MLLEAVEAKWNYKILGIEFTIKLQSDKLLERYITSHELENTKISIKPKFYCAIVSKVRPTRQRFLIVLGCFLVIFNMSNFFVLSGQHEKTSFVQVVC